LQIIYLLVRRLRLRFFPEWQLQFRFVRICYFEIYLWTWIAVLQQNVPVIAFKSYDNVPCDVNPGTWIFTWKIYLINLFVNLKFRANWEENAKLSYAHGDPHRTHFGIWNFCNRVGQTLDTGVQIVTKFTEDKNKMSLKTGRRFSPKP